MSPLLLADLRSKRVTALVVLAAAGGSAGLLAGQTEAGAAVAPPTCQEPTVAALESTTMLDDACAPQEETPQEESTYRLCHDDNDGKGPWKEESGPSRGELEKDHAAAEKKDEDDLHGNDHWLTEDGESCPDPVDPPKEQEPAIVVQEQPAQQQAAQPQQQAPAPQAQSAPSLARRSCGSRRSFRIRVRTRKADPVVRATVSVNGKTVRVLRGSRLTAPVSLSGLPKGRYSITITATTKSGRKLTGVRRYRTCTPKSSRLTIPKPL